MGIFCHFAQSTSDLVYDQVTSMPSLSDIMHHALEEHNETNAAMDLVLFEDAMKHVCRCVRVILGEGGHALMVGVGGSGKQSLSRLAAFICTYDVKQIVISATYSMNDFKDDLKWMYNRAGVRENGVLFLITDNQIVDEKFLIYMNDLLATGNIPDLFTNEEADGIVGAMEPRVKAAGMDFEDHHTCWEFFIGEIRKNLHVSLCFSPVGDSFKNRASRFPALVNCTVIDWFQPWPKAALRSVGKKHIMEIEMHDEDVREAIIDFLPYSFESVAEVSAKFLAAERRHVHTTPKSFLELLALYGKTLADKRAFFEAAIDRLNNGLQKLRETSEGVAELEENLKVQLVEAEEKRVTAEALAEQVGKDKVIVEEKTAIADVEAKKATEISEKVSIQAKNCADDLAKAEPAVEEAMKALDTLNKKDLSECKTMLKPPAGVDDVFAATQVLLAGVHPNVVVNKRGQVKDKSWDAAKKQLMGNIGEYLEALKGFKDKADAGEVPKINWKEVRPYLAKETFTVEVMQTKNSAAAGLAGWVINIVIYYDIVTTVEPKRRALAEANATLDAANARLKEVTELVEELSANLARLEAELAEANATKQAAADAVAKGTAKLDLAQRLVNALASENVRWAENVVKLQQDEELLVGDVLLASAFISYIGPFTKPFRDILMTEKWQPYLATAAKGQPVPMSEDCSPTTIMSTPAEVAVWNNQGLPRDKVSTENAVMVVNSARWPLMIDPQLQGIVWVRNKEAGTERNLQVVRLGQKDIMRKMERAVENGFSVLIENLGESIDAVLQPVISRATVKRGHRMYVKLGETEVEFNPKFRLFLHTKLSNPHYPPEIQAETTLVNFSVTFEGLEDQLLALTVLKERPDLAKRSEELVSQASSFLVKMKELEDDILYRLAHAEGDLTEDVELIEGLEDTKRISLDIEKKSAQGKIIQHHIQETSEKYRSTATHAALLFFLMNDLVKIHTYYIFSLSAFKLTFFRGIDNVTEAKHEDEAEAEENPEGGEGGEDGAAQEEDLSGGVTDEELAARCVVVNDSITITVFDYLRRGLFEVDKLCVGCMLALRILQRRSEDGLEHGLTADEVNMLVMGNEPVDPGSMGPLSEWMPESVWPKVKGLETLKIFKGFGDTMQTDYDDWEKWFELEYPDQEPCPNDYKELNHFYRLLLLRAMRPDRVQAALALWVEEELGSAFENQPAFDMLATLEETQPSTPIFFVLFPGVDPTVWVEGAGNKLGFTMANGKFVMISMGQGQEKPAESCMERFGQEGGWLLLQNCHLMEKWLPTMERLFEVTSEGAHKDFRLMLSAEPPGLSYMKNMPESLMQVSVKVSNEAPADIKSNLRRSWAEFSQETIDTCTKPIQFKACLFMLCWFHSVVQGRRRFGQQGWSRKYPFNTSDLTICCDVLNQYIDANPEVPYADLQYIFGEIMYGGHITDAWDRRTNNTYLEVLLCDGIFKNYEFAAGCGFRSPNPEDMDFSKYADYIETALPAESPPLFGLHMNAELAYLVNYQTHLFNSIMVMSGSGGGDSGGDDAGSGVAAVMQSLLDRLPPEFEMIGIGIMAKPLLEEEAGPFVVVCMQECKRMNYLLEEIRRTLEELEKGMAGLLNMTQKMEDLADALSKNQTPGRNVFHTCNWEALAWPSVKFLNAWYADMIRRCDQLTFWSSDLQRLLVTWLPGLFNAIALITALMQVTARSEALPLDKMTTETHCTMFWEPS